MFWNKDREMGKRLIQMNQLLKKSFENVKKDTTNIFQWINYFYRKGFEQERLIQKLELEISYIPKTRDEIRHIIDSYYSFEDMIKRIKELDYRVQELTRTQSYVQEHHQNSIQREIPPTLQINLSNIEKRLYRLEQKKISIKEKIIKRLTRNSKDYVKSLILSYIKKYEKISALQLKEMLVDEQNFCSKSSFYRLLEEIEELDDIGIVKQGKEKHYIFKIKKIH